MKTTVISTSLTISSLLSICLATNVHSGDSRNQQQNPVVFLPAGRVLGSFLTSRLGKPIYTFRGIRYAQAPVSDLRFKPPVAYKWNGTLDASQEGPACPQYNTASSEDCLRLNVYTTKLPDGSHNPRRPVIVLIHPGGFYSSSGRSSVNGPEYLLDQNIVLVTMNYRLGTLGFLSTGEEDAPGNNGLKDQVMALKWVQENIESFGGNKDSVTLLGCSAGSRSVTLHMVSPMTRGLFHKAIIISGSALGPWPIRDNQMDIAQKQASVLGCPADTSKNIVRCLKTKTAEEIGNSLPAFQEIDRNPTVIWNAVIEKDFGQERYLTEHPIKSIERGNFHKVPFLGGTSKDEFAWKAFTILNNETATKMANEDFEKYAPLLFIYEENTEKSKEVSRSIKSFYLKDQPISNTSITGLEEAFVDSIEGFPTHRGIKLFAKNSDQPVYYYKTTYLGRYTNFYQPGTNKTVPFGVVHADEMIYLFYNRVNYPLFDENYPIEAKTVTRLTTLLANFATTGNPTPQTSELFDNVRWEQFNLQTQKYLDIGVKFQMKQKMFEERYAFWESLFPISGYLQCSASQSKSGQN